MSAVNKQLQKSVAKRFDHAAQLFLKSLKRTQGYSHVQAYELAYLRQLLTARWTKITVQSTAATQDWDRNRVLEHLKPELMQILRRVR